MKLRRTLSKLNCWTSQNSDDKDSTEAALQREEGDKREYFDARRLAVRLNTRGHALLSRVYGENTNHQLQQVNLASKLSLIHPALSLPEVDLGQGLSIFSGNRSFGDVAGDIPSHFVGVINASILADEVEQEEAKKSPHQVIREVANNECDTPSHSVDLTGVDFSTVVPAAYVTDDGDRLDLDQAAPYLEKLPRSPISYPQRLRYTRAASSPNPSTGYGSFETANADFQDFTEASSECSFSITPVADESADPGRVEMLKEAISPWLSRTDLLQGTRVEHDPKSASEPEPSPELPSEQYTQESVLAKTGPTGLQLSRESTVQGNSILLDTTVQVDQDEPLHSSVRAPFVINRVEDQEQIDQTSSDFHSNLSDQRYLSKAIKRYRTNEWTKHLSMAEKPSPDEDPLDRPGSPGVRVHRILSDLVDPAIKPFAKEPTSSHGRDRIDSHWDEKDSGHCPVAAETGPEIPLAARQSPRSILPIRCASTPLLDHRKSTSTSLQLLSNLSSPVTSVRIQRRESLTPQFLLAHPSNERLPRKYSAQTLNTDAVVSEPGNEDNVSLRARQRMLKAKIDPDDVPLAQYREVLRRPQPSRYRSRWPSSVQTAPMPNVSRDSWAAGYQSQPTYTSQTPSQSSIQVPSQYSIQTLDQCSTQTLTSPAMLQSYHAGSYPYSPTYPPQSPLLYQAQARTASYMPTSPTQLASLPRLVSPRDQLERESQARQTAHRQHLHRTWRASLSQTSTLPVAIPEIDDRREILLAERQAETRRAETRKSAIAEEQKFRTQEMKVRGPQLEEAHRRAMRKLQRNADDGNQAVVRR